MKYKGLTLQNVFGKRVKLDGLGGDGGVTPVSTLPEQGEQDKIYHNTTDGKYYVYDGAKYSEFGASTIPVVSHHSHIEHDGLILLGQYNLEPNTLYDTGSMEMQVRTVNNVTTASLLAKSAINCLASSSFLNPLSLYNFGESNIFDFSFTFHSALKLPLSFPNSPSIL